MKALGVAVPRVLLPAASVSCEKYAVIACDQFSAQPAYWRQAEALVGDAPSALRMILPEAYLGIEDPNAPTRIEAAMARYCADGTLADIGETFVYVERQTSAGVRRGLVAALDLEQYDWRPGSASRIRATEQTVVERLPARVEIRKSAPLELPHSMVLVDDAQDTLFGPLEKMKADMRPLYDFELMLGGGRVRGYRADTPEAVRSIAGALTALDRAGSGFLFAMGDGNHSFAAAKACWDALKVDLSEGERETHPARYALCEIVDLYDPGLSFEPIHRLLLGADPAAVQREVGFEAAAPPPLQILQPRLDAWLETHPEAKLEYIHGAQDCRALAAQQSDRLAILFPPFDRASVFSVVRNGGVFVRKSFSMGEARDKRYYLEARKIK
ncbi:MAG: DUF1015 domain-containing protein [Oscillospiraceae bacterium]|nr:DUF1015 domain-containing protein [Oscillospiraceae bacterium]